MDIFYKIQEAEPTDNDVRAFVVGKKEVDINLLSSIQQAMESHYDADVTIGELTPKFRGAPNDKVFSVTINEDEGGGRNGMVNNYELLEIWKY